MTMRWLPLCLLLLLASSVWANDGGFQGSYAAVPGSSSYPPLVANFPGSDLGQKIIACQKSLGNVGTCDARTLTGVQHLNENVDVYGGLLLGPSTVIRAAGAHFIAHGGARILCEDRPEGKGATLIENTQPDQSPALTISAVDYSGIEVADCYFRNFGGVKGDNSIVLDLNNLERGWFHDNLVFSSGSYGGQLGKVIGTCDCYDNFDRNVWVGSDWGLWAGHAANADHFTDEIYDEPGAGTGGVGFYLNGVGDVLIGGDSEVVGTALELGGSWGGTIGLGYYFEANTIDILLDAGAHDDYLYVPLAANTKIVDNSGSNTNHIWTTDGKGFPPASQDLTLFGQLGALQSDPTNGGALLGTPQNCMTLPSTLGGHLVSITTITDLNGGTCLTGPSYVISYKVAGHDFYTSPSTILPNVAGNVTLPPSGGAYIAPIGATLCLLRTVNGINCSAPFYGLTAHFEEP